MRLPPNGTERHQTAEGHRGTTKGSSLKVKLRPSPSSLPRFRRDFDVYRREFSTSDNGVAHSVVISDVEAPGLLGFFYRRFGGSKTGNAFLAANKTYFEHPAD